MTSYIPITPKPPFFISVEGPIGVGKTTLSTILSHHYGFFLLKEIVEENPFLSKFYTDIQEWSFQTEMFFLCNRFKQLEDTQKRYLNKGESVVSDYNIFKNMIFAQQTLTNEKYRKYHQIFDILTSDLPKPNVVIYLKANLETLIHRISQRGRTIEQKIDHRYLETLCKDYEQFMVLFKEKYPSIPLLTFDGDKIDFVSNKSDLNNVLVEVEHVLKGNYRHE